MKGIYFHTEDVDFRLKGKAAISKWLENIASIHGEAIGNLSIVFCSDEYLYRINLEYLKHDEYTDIITFDYRSSRKKTSAAQPAGNGISGDIFISVDRMHENAQKANVSPSREAHRLMAHGLLHLLGYDDKTREGKNAMTRKENYCLSLLT